MLLIISYNVAFYLLWKPMNVKTIFSYNIFFKFFREIERLGKLKLISLNKLNQNG